MLNPKELVANTCADVPAALIDMHFARMPETYFERFAPGETARHVRLLNKLRDGKLATVEMRLLGGSLYEVAIAGVDLTGVLACITSAAAADGFSVQDVQLFTWLAPAEGSQEPTYFIDVLRVSGSLRGRAMQAAADDLQKRLQRSFQCLSEGRLADAQAAACDSKILTAAEAARHTPAPGTPLAATHFNAENQILGGDFRLTRKRASGGMSEVYLAHQASLDRMVVVKVVHGDDDMQLQLQGRMAREAAVLARCSCPHIVQVLASGTGTWAGGRTIHWLAMEYLTGGDLAKWIEAHGPPPQELGLRWFRHALEALSYAHRQGILHRDLKPHNLLLTQDGDVKVADFGLVKRVHEKNDFLSQPGSVMGTPYYMSPEQAMGEPLDDRSDLFSLGTTFFHIFSGKLPFEKTHFTAILVELSQRKTPPSLTDVMPAAPRALQVIFARIMAPHREERYQSAKVVLEDLASYEQRNLLAFADSGAFKPAADLSPGKTVAFRTH